MTTRIKKTIDHVSRLEGQLASIKKELASGNPDCDKVSTILLSASRSFAGLREQCVTNFLLAHYIDEKHLKDHGRLEKLLTLTKG